MTVIATPARPSYLNRDKVRAFMRDYPPGLVPGTGVENVLHPDGVEFSDFDIDLAMEMTLDRYNTIPPETHAGFEVVPKYLMLIGVCGWLCMAEANRQRRNQTQTQDADVAPIGIDDKVAAYERSASAYDQQFEDKAQKLKIARNMRNAWGALASGYARGRGYYG